MPLIQVKLIEDLFTRVQKSQIISNQTDPTVSIKGEKMRHVTSAAVEEASSSEWSIGGQAVTTDAVSVAVASFFVSGCF
jgi:phenylpyruvate tautomerase PptA (4-oxalocrotonate tautomerase family)